MSIRLTVVIPVYNAEKTIELCLNSLYTQRYNNDDYEIICVNDGSTDGTLQILNKYREKANYKIITQENGGPAKARNTGARAAKGEIILFTDSDCELDEAWIKEMILPLENPGVSGVQGAYKTRQKGIIPIYEQMYIESSYKYFKTHAHLDAIGTYSAAYRRKLFLKLGGFNENYKVACGEDFEFSYMLARNGYKIVFNENAICYHHHPENLLRYMLVKYKRGFWRTLMYKNNKDKITKDTYTSPWDKLQLLTVVLFLLSLPLNFINGNFHYLSLVLILFYFALSIRFILFAIKRDLKVAILSPFITFVRFIYFTIGMAQSMLFILAGKIK